MLDSVIQFVAVPEVDPGYLDSVVEVARGFKDSLDFLGVPNELVEFPMLNPSPFQVTPELAQFEGFLASGSRKKLLRMDGTMAKALVLCHSPGLLPYLDGLGVRAVQVMHTLPSFDMGSVGIVPYLTFAGSYLYPAPELHHDRTVPALHPDCVAFPQVVEPVAGPGPAWHEREFDFLWVGRNVARKKLEVFLKLVADLSAGPLPGLKAVVVTDDLKGAALPSCVSYIHGNADRFYGISKVFVSTAYEECSPRTVVKAGLSGCHLVMPQTRWSVPFLQHHGMALAVAEAEKCREMLRSPPTSAQRPWFLSHHSSRGGNLLTTLRTFLRNHGVQVT